KLIHKMIAIKFSCAFLIIATLALVTVVDAFDSKKVRDLVNEARRNAKVGTLEITLDGRLMQAAQSQADYMASIKKMTHDNPAGDFEKRIRDAGYNPSMSAENVAFGPGKRMWMNSPGHRQNILNPDYTNMGVAFGGDKYWSQVFARPA
ncbi:14342_t:CDS:2, partial [Funneliformis caledonium]